VLARGAGHPAPLGLSCLAAAFPGRCLLLDLQDRLPEKGDIPSSGAIPFAAVIVAAAAGWQPVDAAMMRTRLAQLLPESRLILGGPRAAQIGSDWDATLHGTGRVACEWLLKDPKGIDGTVDTLEADLRSPLGVPGAPLAEQAGYAASAEKSGSQPTISVHQPWLGLLDRLAEPAGTPSRGDLTDLVIWLRRSGFGGIAFETPRLSAQRAQQLVEIAGEQGMTISLRFDRATDATAARLTHSPPLQRVWLNPTLDGPDGPDAFVPPAAQLRSNGISIGIRLPVDLLPDAALPLLIEADEISIDHPAAWQPGLLRHHLVEFYWRRGRLWKSLWRLRSAHDLVRWLRGMYGILDAALTR